MSEYFDNDDLVAATADDFADPATLDDPLGPIPWLSERDYVRRDGHEPRLLRKLGLAVLIVLGVAVPITTRWNLTADDPLLFLALLASYMGVGLLLHLFGMMRGPSAWVRSIARRAGPFTVEQAPLPDPRVGFRETAMVRIDLGPPPEPAERAFDPSDPAHRVAAEALYRGRTRDGLALENDTTLQLVTPVIDGDRTRRKARIADWVTVTRWLAARADRRRAWLSAMAWSEGGRWSRAARALALLDADGETVEALYRQGPPLARIAAAVHGQRADRLDVMLADRETAPAVLLQALLARLTLDDPPLDDWLSDPRTSAALITHAPERLAPSHWLALIGHPDPTMAARAAARLVDVPGPQRLAAARALTERMDLRTHTRLGLGHPVTACVARCLSVLGRHGDASDLLRIGSWADVNGMNAIVQRRLDELRAHLVDLPEGGGLALSDMAGGELGLAEPMPGRLTLAEPADPTQPEEP